MNRAALLSLSKRLDAQWASVLKSSTLVRRIRSGDYDERLYALYLIQTYHYTLHNARHQAIVGTRDGIAVDYMRFAFHHAHDESGHELMARQDIESLGWSVHQLPPALPSTEILIAYLYYVSQRGNPLRRLGYSFWAERSYEYIGDVLGAVQLHLGLEDRQITFFRAHSKLDETHAREVECILERSCKGDSDWNAVEEVMVTSLNLTQRMMDEVEETYALIASGSEKARGALTGLAE